MPQTSPLVNIITVTFNAEAVVERTIQSVVNQTYENINYIIIDGKSSDATVAICEKYKDHIGTLVSEIDNGIYDGMNKALDIVNQGWCLFLNAGDTLYSSQTLLNIFGNRVYPASCNLVYGSWIKEGTLNKPLNMDLLKSGVMFACHQAIFFRFLKDTRYDHSMKIHGDLEFLCQYAKAGDFMMIEETVCVYDGGGISTFKSNQPQRRKDKFRTVLRHYGFPGVLNTLLYRIKSPL